MSTKFDYVIIGGGVAGICCAENLCILNEDKNVAVISSSPLIKKMGHVMDDFDIAEADAESIEKEYPRLTVLLDSVNELNANEHTLTLESGTIIEYGKVCICAGAKPKLIAEGNPLVLGIRDTESAKKFQANVETARRVIIVGNGGIAMEIAYEITGCEVVWCVREDTINVVFLDPGAAKFILSRLQSIPVKNAVTKRSKYTASAYAKISQSKQHFSAALGPDWHEHFTLSSTAKTCQKNVDIEYNCEVVDVFESIQESDVAKYGKWPVYVKLSNSKIIGADVVVSATGVKPNPTFIKGNNISVSNEDGGILVDAEMRASVKDVYAAGDVCTPNWKLPDKWVHMRLWSQARILGVRAAQCMTEHSKQIEPVPLDIDISMELFTHVTNFCGFKVVLLGLFNGQRLSHYDVLLRIKEGSEYIKAVVANGRLMGVLLIGDTDLEETFENLLLNDIDVSLYGDSLLDPNIDLADYFD